MIAIMIQALSDLEVSRSVVHSRHNVISVDIQRKFSTQDENQFLQMMLFAHQI